MLLLLFALTPQILEPLKQLFFLFCFIEKYLLILFLLLLPVLVPDFLGWVDCFLIEGAEAFWLSEGSLHDLADVVLDCHQLAPLPLFQANQEVLKGRAAAVVQGGQQEVGELVPLIHLPDELIRPALLAGYFPHGLASELILLLLQDILRLVQNILLFEVWPLAPITPGLMLLFPID